MHKMNLINKFNKFNFFSGYYDRQPLNNEKLLVHKFTDNQLDQRIGPVEVGYIDINTNKFTKIVSTNAWNWQMGSNATWYDEQSIILNDIINNEIKTRIINIITLQSQVLDFHFYNLFNKDIVCINYNNLSHFRESYGYTRYNKNQTIPEISIYDYNFKKTLSIKSKDFLEDNFLFKKIIFEHPFINDRYLTFISRVLDKNKQENYLIIYQIKNQKFIKLNLSNISHMSLFNNYLVYYGSKYYKKNIIAKIYSQIKNFKIIKILKNLKKLKIENTKFHRYITSEGLYLYDLDKNKFETIDDELKYDGHPNFFDEEIIMFDTYPNNDGLGFIIKYDLKNKTKEVIQCLKHNTKFLNKSNRSDIHLKINKNKIIIDRFLEKRFVEIYSI
tara:strand:+ start:2746 stop:3906 length:1161 start_codon:yes stop_codon:yes gene_type:complete